MTLIKKITPKEKKKIDRHKAVRDKKKKIEYDKRKERDKIRKEENEKAQKELDKKREKTLKNIEEYREVFKVSLQLFIIQPCSRCDEDYFTPIGTNTKFTSMHIQCISCEKKYWVKPTDKFYKSEVFSALGAKAIERGELIKNNFLSGLDKLTGVTEYDLKPIRIIANIKSEDNSKRHSISKNIKDKVWNRDEGKCVECKSNENLEFDHIIPVSKGGANTYRNIQLLCEPCNRSKSAKIG